MASLKKTPGKKIAKAKAGPSARRETLASLRAHVDDIEQRLSHADRLTKSSVRALKSSYKKLNERTGDTDAANQENLTNHIEVLTAQLTGLIDKTREDVAHDLQLVLQDPRLETVSAAVTKANHRIASAEADQAGSIRAINEQIAKLATVVDERLKREAAAREEGVFALGKKIDVIENQSAMAVTGIGDKIMAVADEINQRLDTKTENLKQSFSEQSLESRKELEEHKSEIGRRIEALEDDQRNTIPSLERRLVTLTSRLEIVESEQYKYPDHAEQTPPPHTMAQGAYSYPDPITTKQTDAFSPQEAVKVQAVAPPQELKGQEALSMTTDPSAYGIPSTPEHDSVPQIYSAPAAGPMETLSQSNMPQDNVLKEYVPEEYAPTEFAPQQKIAPQSVAPDYAPQGAAGVPYDYQTDAYEAGTVPQTQMAPGIDPYAQQPPPMTGGPQLEVAQSGTLEATRQGGDIIPKRKRKLLSFLKRGSAGETTKSSPIKLFALMTAIAVVGLFAAQKLLPFGGEPVREAVDRPRAAPITQVPATDTGATAFEPEIGETPGEETTAEPRSFESLEVVGDYSDAMQPPELEPSSNGIPSAGQLTLEAAAANGEMVAQFQMGLAHLATGQTDDAIRLIRLAANQGQPAAQYRLAKLYESGVGIEKDLNTAMKLLSRSANAGNRIAMHDLGHYYATGTAVDEPDIAKAVNWFQQAANRGVLDSQFNLGVLYQEGSGVAQNSTEAFIWYSVAGAQGDRMAVQRAEMLARDLPAQQLEQATSRIKAFTPMRIDEPANGIFTDTPWAPQKKQWNAKAGSSVKNAQKMLADLGYNIGAPDGAMGPKTRNAIISFERANGLPETGRVSGELIDRLSLAAGV